MRSTIKYSDGWMGYDNGVTAGPFPSVEEVHKALDSRMRLERRSNQYAKMDRAHREVNELLALWARPKEASDEVH